MHDPNESDPHREVEIAIIAISCRAPHKVSLPFDAGPLHLDALKQHLWAGDDLATEFSDEELREAGVAPEHLEQANYVRRRAILPSIYEFDAQFFGLTPREAALTDPQHRLFLECCWEALESAVCDPTRYEGPIGVFAGSSLNGHMIAQLSQCDPGTLEGYDLRLANGVDFLATRTSYKLGLSGPSLNLQTACSTSLVAVHLACQSLLSGECDLALAGGSSIMIPQEAGYLFQDGSIASPDGRCRPFDAEARGTISGNGVGVVVLKRFEDAVQDRNQIRAVIRGSAINNDGAQKIGFTAPSIDGQAAAIEEALATADATAESIGYVEAHGTGTPLGDPIEVTALTQAFAASRESEQPQTGFCGLGSVKGNLGHLDAAAGVFGLIKAALAVEAGEIPPSIHFRRPNPAIDFETSPFYVNTKLRAWPESPWPRRAGVSSFGIGGTNAHMIVEEPPHLEPGSESRRDHVLILSAKTSSALETLTDRLADHLESLVGSDAHRALADTAFSLQNGRRFLDHRRVLVAADPGKASQELRERGSGVLSKRTVTAPRVAFLFPGQGSQHAAMTRDLYEEEPEYREIFDSCCEILLASEGIDARRLLFDEPRERQEEILRQTEFTQPLLFAVEYSLARLWMSRGVEPIALLGHSVGEYVAACVAGVFSLEEGLHLIAQRARRMQQSDPGAMLSVAVPREALDRLVDPNLLADLSLAAVNDYSSCVLSGRFDDVERLAQELARHGIESRKLQVSHPFHSKQMTAAAARFAQDFAPIRLSPPQIPIVSNLSGDWLTIEDATDPGYWIRHLLGTVRFADGVAKLLQQEDLLLLEVGPGTTLTNLARRQRNRASKVAVVHSLQRPPRDGSELHDGAAMMTALGRLWLAGVEIDWPSVYGAEDRLPIELPTYPFERQTHRPQETPRAAAAGGGARLDASGRKDLAQWFYVPGWRRAPAVPDPATEISSRRWILLDDDLSLALDLEEALRAAGADVHRFAPSQFPASGPTQDQETPHIVFFAGREFSADDFERVKQTVRRLLNEFSAASGRRGLRIDLVTTSALRVLGDEAAETATALLHGVSKVLAQEHPEAKARRIDVEASTDPKRLAQWLLSDVCRDETTIAIRGSSLWLPTLDSLELSAPTASFFRDEGVYVITGGLGGIGLTIAEEIAENRRPRLILLGRRATEKAEVPHVAEALDRLRRAGAVCRIVDADVADAGQVAATIAHIHREDGAIHGVIHAAGVGGGRTLLDHEASESSKILAAKVRGAEHLERALLQEDLTPDFFVVFSSLSTVLGGVGLSDYVAANAYLESFAERPRSGSTRYLAISWDVWRDVGMAVSADRNVPLQEKRLEQAVAPSEGREAFRRALASGQARIVVSTLDPQEARSFTESLDLDAEEPADLRPDLETLFVAPRNDLEEKIAEVWRRLLGIGKIGVHDSFYDLGGHSLLATQITSRLQQIGVALSVDDLLRRPTIAEAAEAVGEISARRPAEQSATITRIPRDGRLPLSFSQRGLWFDQEMRRRLRGDDAAYNMEAVFSLSGPLDLAVLIGVLRRIAERHETLRTSFRFEDAEPFAAVEPLSRLPLEIVDLTRLDESTKKRTIRSALRNALRTPFDLRRAPLWRALLLRTEDDCCLLQCVFHHIIFDGWSIDVLHRDLTGLLAGHRLPELPIQYVDFAARQRDEASEANEAHLDFWKEKLSGVPVPTLPTDRPRSDVPSFFARSARGRIEPELGESLNRLGVSADATLFMTLTAIFQAWIGRISHQPRFVVGSPISTRSLSETEDLIGFFVHHLPLLAAPDDDLSFYDLLLQVRDFALEAFVRQDAPLEKLIAVLGAERRTDRNPIFQHILTLAHSSHETTASDSGLVVKPVLAETRQVRLDLELHMLEQPDGAVDIRLLTRADLFDASTTDRFLRQFLRRLETVARDPDRRLGDVEILSPAERHHLVVELGDTAAAHREENFFEIFARNARRRPDAVALIEGRGPHRSQIWTYRALHRRALRLSAAIRELAFGESTPRIGVMTGHRRQLAVAILGIWNADAVYVPLDPTYPKERLRHMVREAKLDFILTTDDLRAVAEDLGGAASSIDDLLKIGGAPGKDASGRKASGGKTPQRVDRFAYMIFTSGSTGLPKGALTTHSGLSNLAFDQPLETCSDDRVLQLAALGFDASIFEICLAWAAGAALFLQPREEALIGPRLGNVLHRHRITQIVSTPSVLGTLPPPTSASPAALRTVLTAGEACPADLAREWQTPNRRVINAYGPTETTVCASRAPISHRRERPSIGRALSNTRIVIVDPRFRLVPIGVHGELLIGGASVGDGYFRRPRKTAMSFVPDPWSEDAAGPRLYRSGDLARRLPDGEIDFLGRIDHQIKIRGQRIEPGEIEQELRALTMVREALVAAIPFQVAGRALPETRLAAYLVVDDPSRPELKREVRDHLARRIPEGTIPAYFVILDELPRLPNGKFDRKNLPHPNAQRTNASARIASSDEQRILIEVFEEVLGVEDVGLDDDFFELGGDSILILRIVAAARRRGVRVTARDLFEHPNVEELTRVARLVDAESGEIDEADAKREIEPGPVPLSPIQRWLLERPLQRPDHANQSVLLALDEDLDAERLRRALARITNLHGALSLRFRRDGDDWLQEQETPSAEATDEILIESDLADLSEDEYGATIEAYGAEIQSGLALDSGPLLRAVLFAPARRLLIVIHHLAVDVLSWRVFLEDLETAYRTPDALDARSPMQFSTWARRIPETARKIDDEPWSSMLSQASTNPPLAGVPASGAAGGGRLSTEIDVDASRRLLREAPRAYRTRDEEIPLAALAATIARVASEPRVLLEVESHGRAALFDDFDLHDAVGWFAAKYPVVFDLPHPDSSLDARGVLRTVKETLRTIPDLGVGFGLLRDFSPDPEIRDRFAEIRPEIGFNWVGEIDRGEGVGALWRPVREPHGPDEDPTSPPGWTLYLNGAVIDGRVVFDWIYDRARFAEEDVRSISELFHRTLADLVEHAAAQDREWTPADLPSANLDQASLDRLVASADLTSVVDLYPLTSMQQGMLFHALIEPDSPAYFEQIHWLAPESLDVARFRDAWERAIRREEILRTGFFWDELEEPLQAVYENCDLPWFEVDLPPEADEDALAELLRDDAARGFDLNTPPLLRVTIVRRGGRPWRIVWSCHHIILDGWSSALLLGDVFADTFDHAADDALDAAPSARRPFRDFISWLRENRNDEAASEFWRNELRGAGETTTQPPGFRADGAAQRDKEICSLVLGSESLSALQSASANARVTLNTLVLGAWMLTAARCNAREDALIGVTSAGRPPELDGSSDMLGLFINTLPLYATATDAQVLGSWLQSLQRKQAQMRRFEHAPLYQIQQWAQIEQGASDRDRDLFTILFVYENYPPLRRDDDVDRLQDVRGLHETEYPLTLTVTAQSELKIRATYDDGRVDKTGLLRGLHALRTLLLDLAIGDAARRLADLRYLPDAQRHQILCEWNDPATAQAERSRSLDEAILDRARRTPDRVAVSFHDRRWSYAALARRSAITATRLAALGAGPETAIAILLPRGPEMVAALLAALRSGSAYVPLDPRRSPELLAAQLRDSRAICAITDPAHESLLPNGFLRVRIGDAALESTPTTNCGADEASRAAYVLYTSGSTGKPKGVVVEHRQILNYVFAVAALLRRAPGSRTDERFDFALVQPLTVDSSATALFLPLVHGGRLTILDEDEAIDAHRTLDVMRRDLRQGLKIAPTHLRALSDAQSEIPLPEILPSRWLVFGGEGSPIDWGRRLLDAARGRPIYNHYGPTEATVGSHAGRLLPRLPKLRGARTVPIGRPLFGVRAYVTDRRLRPTFWGVAGELLLGGVCVTRGYLGRPEATAASFVPDPFDGSGERLYRTGDLTKFHLDGSLEHLGRGDHQVKIRGFRVELGEIEAALAALPQVREAVAFLDGETLFAVCTPRGDERPTLDAVRDPLARRLPPHAIPAALFYVESLPRTSHGKLNRRALRDLVDEAPQTDRPIEGRPHEATEEIVAQVWQEVLGGSAPGPIPGPEENFFELGGHSLHAARVVSRLRSISGVDLSVRDLFEQPVLAQLARTIRARLSDAPHREEAIVAAPRTQETWPLSFAQQRLWFLAQLEPGSAAYHTPSVLRLRGALRTDALRAALIGLIRRHESLRTCFRAGPDGEPVQIVLPDQEGKVTVVDLRTLPEAQREKHAADRLRAEILRPFDLENGPLLRALLLRLDDEEHLLLIDLHHIISDAWSKSVLFRDLAAGYEAALSGSPPQRPKLSIQPLDFAVHQQRFLSDEGAGGQLEYWRRELADHRPIDLPTDRPRPRLWSDRGTIHRLTLPLEEAEALQRFAREQGISLFMLLTSATFLLLYRLSGQDPVLGTPIAHRSRREIEHLIGFFMNTLVLRTHLRDEPTVEELIRRVRERCLGAYAHQDLPFERLVEELHPERDLSRNPFFQTTFTFQNVPRLESSAFPDLEIVFEQPLNDRVRFDLEIFAWLSQDGLELSAVHSLALFDRTTARRWLHGLRRLLVGMTHAPQTSCGRIEMLSAAQRRQIFFEWNEAAVGDVEPDHFLRRFRDQVRTRPDAPALGYGDVVRTYRALDRESDRLARNLRNSGVGPERLVGVLMERSERLPITLIAIWKAGGAYVPMDPSHPEKRLAIMREQVDLTLEDETFERLTTMPQTAPQSDANTMLLPLPDRDRLAYVIFTSGSTGRPKGVQIAHAQLDNFLASMAREPGLRAGEALLAGTTISFDIAGLEIFLPLTLGARAALAPRETMLDPDRLAEALRRERIDVFQATPASWRMLVDAGWNGKSDLRALCGGEALAPALARALLDRCGEVWNLYGPTETTVWSLLRRLRAPLVEVPIGRPIASTQVRICDARLRPVGAGIVGELCLGGAGVARGYLDRPALTAARFVPDPIAASGEHGARLYRTGDLARRKADGEAEFLGRFDHQVKIRGYRIELGDIETCLEAHPRVERAVAEARGEQDHRRVIAWIVASTSPEERVEQWADVWEETYSQSESHSKSQSESHSKSQSAPEDSADAARFDLSGWTSSFTGEPIPAADMQRWVDDTVRNILALEPRTVLEVGCGTGLLLHRVAPHADLYCGLDVSDTALRGIRRALDAESEPPNVDLRRLAAHEVETSIDGLFDVVVINSVAQYFPDVEYFLDVVRQVATKIRPGGKIFLGDLRDLDLADDFYAAIEQARHPDRGTQEIAAAAQRRRAAETELLFGRGLFGRLPRAIPAVIDHQIVEKASDYDPELSVYRYDAILEIGDPAAVADLETLRRPIWRDWTNRASPSQDALDSLREHAAQHLPDYMTPSAYVFLPEFPLTPNGKIDRRALPEPELQVGSGRVPQTSSEKLLAAIWSELLGLSEVFCDSDFFALGGHSLLAVRMLSRVDAETGVRLPLTALFRASRLEAVAKLVDQSSAEQSDSALVLLRDAEDAGEATTPVVVLLHPVGGRLLCYRSLTLELPGTRIYGLQSPEQDAEATTPDLHTTARRYLDELLERVSPSDCHLVGWSMGGVVAHEMACILQDDGKDFSSLTILDVVPPETLRLYQPPEDEQEHRLQALASFSRDLGLAGVSLPSAEDSNPPTLEEGLRIVLNAAQEADALSHFDLNALERLYRGFLENARRLREHQTRRYDGACLVVATTDSRSRYDLPKDLGWRPWCREVRTAEIEGDHHAMLRSPTVEDVGKILVERIFQKRQGA